MASPQILHSDVVEGMLLAELDRVALEDTWVNQISRTINVNTPSQRYSSVGSPPLMEEWTGEGTSQELNVNQFTVANKPYRAAMKVDKRDIMYDATGVLEMRIGELAQSVNLHRTSLISNLIDKGTAQTGIDGLNFYDTAHVTPGAKYRTAQSNALSIAVSDLKDVVTGTTKANPTLNQFMIAIERGRAALQSFRSDQGVPVGMNIRQFLVMAPTQYASQVNAANRALVNSDQVTSGMSGSTYTAVVNPYLTAADAFYMFALGVPTPALGFQVAKSATLTSQAAGSYVEFRENAWEFAVDYEAAAFYADWKKSVRILLT